MKIESNRPDVAYAATHSLTHPLTHPLTQTRQRGFTLIELMIASTLALFMLIGVSQLFLSSLSSEKTSASAAEITTNGRYAIDVLRRELMHSGYRGLTWAPPTWPLSTTVGTISGECIGTGFATNLRQGIWGANDANPFAATCIPTSNYSTGDVMVIRHAGLTPTPTASLVATGLYFRSAYERGEVFKGSESVALGATFTQAPNFNYALETKVYYISPFTDSTATTGRETESPRVPALYRVATTVGPAMRAELVASNIEDMQIRYGRYKTNQRTQYYSGAQVSATANSTTTASSEWNEINSVRIWILVRSSKPEPGYTNTSTYNLGDKTVTVNDGYRRELYSTVVQMRNI